MTLAKLNIEQQRARISIETTMAKLHVEMPDPEMVVHQERVEMDVERTDPSFEVDYEKTNEELGYVKPLKYSKDLAKTGAEKGRSNISKTAKDADYLGDLTIPGPRIAHIARRDMKTRNPSKFNNGRVPNSMPSVKWDPGHIQINWTDYEFSIEWDGSMMPEVYVEPYSVEIYLEQKPYIRITLDEVAVPSWTGRQVDTEI